MIRFLITSVTALVRVGWLGTAARVARGSGGAGQLRHAAVPAAVGAGGNVR